MGGPAHPEPRRARDREHVKFVEDIPVLIVVGVRPILTTCNLRKAERLDER